MKKHQQKTSLREMFNLSRLAIKYSWLTVCFWLIITVAGFFAFTSLKYALFPDINFPIVVVNAKLPAATTLETESQLTIPLEKKLLSLGRIDELYSSIYPGQSAITVLFKGGENLQLSTEKVKAKVEATPLPKDASYDIIPFNLNESTTISYAIKNKSQTNNQTSSKTINELTEIAEEIIPSISNLPGVLKVNLLGNDSLKENDNQSIKKLPSLVHFNGEDAIAFEVVKTSKANTLEVVSKVEKAISNLTPNFPDIDIVLAQTQADYIQEATQATIDTLLAAIIIAVLVIFAFLRNLQATFITALAIPISLLGTFIVMAIFGFNLETITLLALALVIGIIVDDAIVEVENISRYLEAGNTPKNAAILATNEIGFTVSASTLTIVAVFLPVALMGSTIGKFFKPFGITISAAVITSLFVARSLSPVLAVYWLKFKSQNQSQNQSQSHSQSNSQNTNQSDTNPPQNVNKQVNLQDTISTFYLSILRWSLHHRWLIITIAIVSFIAGIALIPLIPKGFIPKLDRGEFNIIYTTPLPKIPSGLRREKNSLSQTQSDRESSESFSWISNLSRSPQKILLRRTNRVGNQLEKVLIQEHEIESIFTISGVRGELNKGKIYVKLKNDRQLNTGEIQKKIRGELPNIPRVNVSVEDIQFVNTESEKNFQIVLVGEDLETISKSAEELKAKIQQNPGFVDINLQGNIEDINNIIQIEHINGKRGVYLSANLNQGYALGDAINEAQKISKNLLPEGVSLQLWGTSSHGDSVIKNFARTLILSILCMLLVLTLPFGRLLEPMVVILSLPLSIIGAMLGLLITQSDLGMISLIGLIFLLGLLDKNAILLLDYINQLRQQGREKITAILETGKVRFRPILMTTTSTILGMLPIALGIGAGAELRQPMAVAIIGGLITSSLLSLIVVPIIYSLLDDLWCKIFKQSNHKIKQ